MDSHDVEKSEHLYSLFGLWYGRYFVLFKVNEDKSATRVCVKIDQFYNGSRNHCLAEIQRDNLKSNKAASGGRAIFQ